MKATQIIPILRIFDYKKAVEFYVDWLGFEIVWEHYFDENTPVYMEVKRENIIFHLSEHHGDGSPGIRVAVWGEGVPDYHRELTYKKYKYNRPGLEKTFYNAVSFTVIDPSGNKITFEEEYNEEKHKDLEFYSIH
ncbi:MAG: VOC family protein [Chryseobacterium sp.]|jgi:catechol 2,3-dioxygenase-like lactoylglutathione lyase family enzyme|uniref:glyoxalase superfamily protein n=1 Tax=Chryseobacterium sp. TaxID=1871047 RepID=UPI0028239179|nr:glyoxalase superfamily protein [Chryseobacterium sp.]MDR2236106.1 VOC family protein [Chryseobacterium sp.]